jgi:hypothetical protein
MYYSPSTGAVILDGKFLDQNLVAAIKARVPSNTLNGLRCLVVSLADKAMMEDSLQTLTEWANFIGKCRYAGISPSSLEAAFLKEKAMNMPSYPLPEKKKEEVVYRRPSSLFSYSVQEQEKEEESEEVGTPVLEKKIQKPAQKPAQKPPQKQRVKKVVSKASSLTSPQESRKRVYELHGDLGFSVKSLANGKVGVVVSSQKGVVQINWKDGSTQTVTVKTLKDKRRFERLY